MAQFTSSKNQSMKMEITQNLEHLIILRRKGDYVILLYAAVTLLNQDQVLLIR